MQALQDLDRLGDRRLADVDPLEPARQRAIALERLAVVLERRRADAAQLAVRQRRLEDVGGVHRAAAGRAGADDGVDLVDEQDRLRIRDQDLHHGLEALLEVAAIARAGEHRRHVERVELRRPSAAREPCSSTMRSARPSASAVLPTPGSPISSGLFFRRRHSTWIIRSSSSARPISGSILPSRARCVRSTQKLSSGFATLPSSLAVVLDAARARHDRTTAGLDLRDAVRDVVDDVEPRHALLLEQVDRVRVALAEHRRDHVAGRHLLAAGGLDVHRRALEHALERERLIGSGLLALGKLVDLLVEEALEIAAQASRRRHRTW